jgi:RHS repeat-associated protein
MITNPVGTVCYDADYFPYGSEQATPTNNCAQNYKFTGKERDPDLGMDDFGARWYLPTLARFLTPDWSGQPAAVPYAALTDPQTLNLYSYVRNNPLAKVDPDGHGLLDWALRKLKGPEPAPPPPPPPAPEPPPMAELKTDMQGHTTTLYTTDKNGDLTTTQIETRTDVVKGAKPGAADPYTSDVVGASNRHAGDPAYGPAGAFIDTGDSRGRDIHGGGSSLGVHAFDPQQPLTPTLGCTRGHNEDVTNLGNAITNFQQANPSVVIPYVRE